MRCVFVTGANGFVGRPLCRRLLQAGWQVKAGVRSQAAAATLPSGVEVIETPDVSTDCDWTPLFAGVDSVVHLVGRTHVVRERNGDPTEAYRTINVAGSLRVARGALQAGVSRFLFMSSIKAVGEGAPEAYTEQTVPEPEDAYGASKLEAEGELVELFRNESASLTIVRPPLIYGAGVKGNLQRLMRLTRSKVSIPLGAIQNARSMVYVENLADCVCRLIGSTARGVYHVADPQPLSTPELLQLLADLQGTPSRLVSVPTWVLKAAGRLCGMSGEVRRLTGSLTVSSDHVQREAGWTPPFTVQAGIKEMVDSFAAEPDRQENAGRSQPARKAA